MSTTPEHEPISHAEAITGHLLAATGLPDTYREVPEFHQALDFLVAMLPSMVRGLAVDADVAARHRHAAELLMRAPSDPAGL